MDLTPKPHSEPPPKQLPPANGVLKLHQHLHPPAVVTFKECLKNHAAALGGHALDGCGEFMPSPNSTPSNPSSLKCAACGCHRNFHRREPEDPISSTQPLEFRPHHRHQPLPPPGNSGSSPNDSPSPPPISSSYYPSAPHMLLALSHGLPDANIPISAASPTPISSSNSRKRFRTKFTQNQKDKMQELAEKVGWKMQKTDEISQFCTEIGVDRSVFKVWMHNNKNTFSRKDATAISDRDRVVNFSDNGGAIYHREDDVSRGNADASGQDMGTNNGSNSLSS